ncbi:hypothetical protein AZF06_21535 [Priestia endophytica]|uniref:Uncharacterized protein n=2 Tax=Priestia endophytica TaxID=135735 RepID=A0A1I6C0H7_9BACI|nr:hypothetical protein AZF06_21535 [Priestia endophytica]SFQ86671.1 hypothetical protein SAMN02745910_04695 [Priestia endophytica DSM 13796]
MSNGYIGGDNMNFDPMARINQQVNDSVRRQKEAIDKIVENKRNAEQIQIEQRDFLKEISADVKGINEIIALVRENNEINEQTFKLLQEVLTIITAKTPEEANDILGNVVDTANKANETWGTIQAIISYGKMLGKLTFPESGLFD